MNQLRNFEISIWTLQDDFITIIESAWIKSKGKTQNASMTLNIDGTQQLTFSVPMYYYDNGEMVINPVWTSFTGDKVLLNTRKVKVILNKQTDNEEIYEFVIDKITERHDNDEFYCDVECSGLAFYELGKIGYKVSLSEEDFYNDDYKWFTKEEDSEENILVPEQPVANIQYWLNKFLMPYPLDESVSAATWYYKIQMNWDLTAEGKAADKVYENDIYGDTYLLNQEKYRMINLEESNFYNLTQNIAETFGVYCKYIYSYDENYHIIGRTIVFYNNFLNEENLSINYRGNTQSVSRELDTTDLVTKMFVRTVDNNGDTTSIIDVEENDSGEDYLLNFDYLYSIGSVDEESYNKIDSHKAILKVINTELKSVTDVITNIENALPELYARRSIAEDSIQIDKEKINTSDKLLKSITGGSDWIKITKNNPDTAVLLKESEANYYYIKLTKQGIDPNSVVIYNKMLSFDSKTKSYNFSENNKIKTAIPVYDDANNLIRMTNIYYDEGNSQRSKIVYLTYRYKPTLYYENVIKAWQKKLAKDELELNEVDNLIKEYETELKDKKEIQKQKIDDKNSEINSFERMMGPAIREGYWQPEDYSEHVETFSTSYKLNKGQNNSEPYKTIGGTPYDSFFWDEKLFDGEQDIKYQIGIEQNVVYYPCIDLTLIWNSLKANLNSFSFIFYDTAVKDASGETQGEIDDPLSLRVLSLGSGAQIAFIKGKRGSNNAETIFPVLILTGLQNDIPATISAAKQNGFIGIINYVNNSSNPYTIESRIEVTNRWLTLSNSYKIVYPRIRIESISLKTDTNSLIIRDNENILNQYVDYYINNKTQESFHLKDSPIVDSHYITIKPAVIFKSENWSGNNEWTQLTGHKIEVLFRIANCAISIYRDAKEILKDSSKPKVSYSATIDILNNNIISRPSYFLSKIIKINDYDLLLDNAWGYVSSVTLDLDHPENDNIEIQNYTNKFEDLFTTIVAQTEAMKKTSYIVDTISNSFTSDGYLTENTLKNSLSKVDLNYAFNNGNLTIDEVNGIWGISDSGVVAFRGGGIFTATERDKRNNWIWNTGVTPEGINADLITAGQLDTNKIRVFAGDRERFQLNADGLFAYKSFLSDFDFFADNPRTKIYGPTNNPSSKENDINNDSTLDPAQFVRFDENGLFLIAKEGAYVLNKDKTDYIVMTKYIDPEETISRFDSDNELKRVSISWDGLTLKNYEGDNVFYADSVSGDLYLKGSVFADAFYVINEGNVTQKIATYITDTSMHELKNQLEENRNVGLRVKDYISSITGMISGKHLQTKETVPKTFTGNVTGNTPPIDSQYSDGDYYYANDGRIFVYVVEKKEDGTETKNWDLVTTLSNDEKASMTVDAINGNIRLFSNKIIDILAANENDSSILSIKPEGITMGTSKKINITSGAEINIDTDGKFSAIGGEALIATSKDWESADASNFIWMHYDETLKKEVLEIATDDLKIKSGGNFIVGAGGNVQIGAGGSITLLSSNSSSDGESGISLSGEGITIGTNASLNIQAGSLMITGTNASSGKNIGKYVSDEISDKTKNSIIGVDVEYNSNKDPKNPPSENDSNWNTAAPEWDGEKYIWQRTVTTINELDESGQNKKVYSAPTCISGANGKTGDGINSVSITYAISQDGTNPPTSGWSSNVPTSVAEKTWLWVKTETTYTGTLGKKTTYTKSYIGKDGKDGKSVYIQSSSKEGDTTTIVLMDEKTGEEKTLKIKDGEEGKNGIPGDPGQNSYIHIAWANGINGEDLSTSESTNKKYIGVYTDDKSDDSENFEDYHWALIKGADGKNGINQVTVYLYQWAATSPTELPSDSLTYDFNQGQITEDDSLDRFQKWKKTIGEKPSGISSCYITSAIAISAPGATICTISKNTWVTPVEFIKYGADGTSVKILGSYSTKDELDEITGFEGDAYIVGKNLYVWVQNEKRWKDVGQIQGEAGTSQYMFIRYADTVLTSTSSDFYDTPKDSTLYIGVAVVDTDNAPNTAEGYTWSKYIGLDGVNRATITLYQRAKAIPNKDSSKPITSIYTFKTDSFSREGYEEETLLNGWSKTIPSISNDNSDPCWAISVNALSSTDTDTIYRSEWSWPPIKIEGEDGVGINMVTIQYVVADSDSSSAPTSGWQSNLPSVSKGKILWVKTTTTYTNGDSDDTYTKTYMGADGESIVITGTQPITNAEGTAGQRITFSDGHSIDIYDGKDGDIGTLDGNVYVHIAWTDKLGTANTTAGWENTGFTTNNSESTNKKYLGILRDNIVEDSKKGWEYSWTLIKGEDGVGISSIKEQYYIANSSVTIDNIPKDPDSSGWTDECPSWSSEKTIWTSSLVTWENGTQIRTDPVKAEGINSANANAATAKQDASEAKQKAEEALEAAGNKITVELQYQLLRSSGKIIRDWGSTKPANIYSDGQIRVRIKVFNGIDVKCSKDVFFSDNSTTKSVSILFARLDEEYDYSNPPEYSQPPFDIEGTGHEYSFDKDTSDNIWVILGYYISNGNYDGLTDTLMLINGKDFFSREETFYMLTGGDENQGIFMKDNKLYINAEYMKTGELKIGGTNIDESRGPIALKIYDSNDKQIGVWDKNGFWTKGDFALYSNDQSEDDNYLLKIQQATNEYSAIMQLKNISFDNSTLDFLRQTIGNNIFISFGEWDSELIRTQEPMQFLLELPELSTTSLWINDFNYTLSIPNDYNIPNINQYEINNGGNLSVNRYKLYEEDYILHYGFLIDGIPIEDQSIVANYYPDVGSILDILFSYHLDYERQSAGIYITDTLFFQIDIYSKKDVSKYFTIPYTHIKIKQKYQGSMTAEAIYTLSQEDINILRNDEGIYIFIYLVNIIPASLENRNYNRNYFKYIDTDIIKLNFYSGSLSNTSCNFSIIFNGSKIPINY